MESVARKQTWVRWGLGSIAVLAVVGLAALLDVTTQRRAIVVAGVCLVLWLLASANRIAPTSAGAGGAA
jgi:hypothetical protein